MNKLFVVFVVAVMGKSYNKLLNILDYNSWLFLVAMVSVQASIIDQVADQAESMMPRCGGGGGGG